MCVTWKRRKRLGIGNVTDHRLWRMENIVLICFLSFLSIDLWVQRCWPRATPDFGSVKSVISSSQGILIHAFSRLGRRLFKRSLLLRFQAHIRAYHVYRIFCASGGPPGRDIYFPGILVPRYVACFQSSCYFNTARIKQASDVPSGK